MAPAVTSADLARSFEEGDTPAVPARVLVVDDDELLLGACARALERVGYQVLRATDGLQALGIVQTQRVDAVVSDIALPRMSGVELLTALRGLREDLPVILTTGAPSLETAIHAVDQAANAYLPKPFDVHCLRSTLQKALNKAYGGVRLSESGVRKAPSAAECARADFQVALDRLWPAFQPIHRSADGSLYGYEALMRSDHEPYRNPAKLLQLAADVHALWSLGRAMRDRIAEAVAKTPNDVSIFVNVSPHELTDPHLYEPSGPLAAIAHRVVLEITERASLDEVDDVTARVGRLRRLGYRIAVDDLGAGYSGLSALVMLEPDVVKIDMSLVRDVHISPRKRALIRSLSQASKDCGAVIVAEGIEIDDERAVLIELGCDLLQGYLLGKPARWG